MRAAYRRHVRIHTGNRGATIDLRNPTSKDMQMSCSKHSPEGVWAWKKGAKTRDSTAISLMRMFSDGPEVSFSGSPTVSPMTAALCASEPLPPRERACSVA